MTDKLDKDPDKTVRENFESKQTGMKFPVPLFSHKKVFLSGLYTIRAEDTNTTKISSSTNTHEYRFMVKELNSESHTDPESFPSSDPIGRYIDKEFVAVKAELGPLFLKTVILNFNPTLPFESTGGDRNNSVNPDGAPIAGIPIDNPVVVSAKLGDIGVRTVLKNFAQSIEDSIAVFAELGDISVTSVVINHNQPNEETIKVSASLDSAKLINMFPSFVSSTDKGGNSNSIVVNVPSAAVQGDVLILILCVNDNTVATNASWTERFRAYQSNTLYVFTLDYSDEAIKQYTFTLNRSTFWSSYCYVAESYINYDYTLQDTRTYTSTTGDELRVIGFDDNYLATTYMNTDISLESPVGAFRAGYPKYIENINVRTAGVVNKIGLASNNTTVNLKVAYPTLISTKQLMVIVESKLKKFLFSPTSVIATFVTGNTLIPDVDYDPYFDNTVGLLHFEGNFNDATGATWTNDSTATIESTGAIFGNSSLKVDGFGDGLSRTNPINNTTIPFTIETYFVLLGSGPTNSYGNNHSILWMQNNNSGSGEFGLGYRAVDGIILFLYGGSNDGVVTYPTTLSLHTRYHIAHTYDGTTHRVLLDGVKIIETIRTFGWKNTSEKFRIGQSLVPNYSNYRMGSNTLFDSFRITKGIARYISNFTVPNNAFPYIRTENPNLPSVKLVWVNDSKESTSQIIYKSTSSFTLNSLPSSLITLPTSVRSYYDSAVVSETTYYYMIASVGYSGKIEYSELISITTPTFS